MAGCPAGVTNDTAEQFGLDEDLLVVVHAMDEADPIGNASTVSIDTRYGTHAVELRRSTTDSIRVDRGGVSVSQRLVSIEGTQYRLTVWVW
jgi:MinD-like ATPase involved in chromosome partitioning or flagellar assembly